MNKISKILIAMFLLSSVVPSFAQAATKFRDIRNCVKLNEQSKDHSEWSEALSHLTSSNKLTDQQLHPIYVNTLKKITKDIQKVRKFADVTEEDRESTILDEAKDLLEKVQDSNSVSKDNERMKEKLFELDDEMFKTLRAAERNIPNCRLSESGSGSSSEESEDAEDAVN